jgi:hypothetical protein
LCKPIATRIAPMRSDWRARGVRRAAESNGFRAHITEACGNATSPYDVQWRESAMNDQLRARVATLNTSCRVCVESNICTHRHSASELQIC